MTETPEESEARFAAARARQAEYAARPDVQAAWAKRIADGLCAIEDGRCVTHDTKDTADHHFRANLTAFND